MFTNYEFLATQIVSNYSDYKKAIHEYSDIQIIISFLIKGISHIKKKRKLLPNEKRNVINFTKNVTIQYQFILLRELVLIDELRYIFEKDKALITKLRKARNWKQEKNKFVPNAHANEYNEDIMASIWEMEKKLKIGPSKV